MSSNYLYIKFIQFAESFLFSAVPGQYRDKKVLFLLFFNFYLPHNQGVNFSILPLVNPSLSATENSQEHAWRAPFCFEVLRRQLAGARRNEKQNPGATWLLLGVLSCPDARGGCADNGATAIHCLFYVLILDLCRYRPVQPLDILANRLQVLPPNLNGIVVAERAVVD